MMTDFQQRKMDLLFDAYDANKNGYLQDDDFDRVAQRYSERLGDTPLAAQGQVWFRGLWEQGISSLADSQGRVDRTAWRNFLDGVWSDQATFEQVIQSGVTLYMRALDTDGDNKLRADEYRHLFYALSMDEAIVDEVFPLLDTNHDGYLTTDEYAQRVREFYEDDPQAPGNWILGRF